MSSVRRTKVSKNSEGVRIFTTEVKSLYFINSCDIWFYNICGDDYQKGMSFLNSCSKYIMLIDRAKIVNDKLGKIETPYGICSIYDFSTGLKTILVVLYLLKYHKNKKYLVNICGCGDKVISIIFGLVNNSNISLYLRHDVLDMPDDITYFVNDEKLDDPINFVDYL